MTSAAKETSYRRPRDAATLILIDRTSDPPKVLLGRRHDKHVFMPGKFVFPGGRVEPQDRLMPFVHPLHPHTEAWLMKQTVRPSIARARAFALAAIRETFEETGLLVGGKRADAPPVPGGPWSDIAKTGFYPDLGAMHFIARAITPPGRTRRFDARFFCADASAIVHRAQNVIHPEAELVELVWLPITEAKRIDMPGITGKVWTNCRPAAPPASPTTCRCRSSGCATASMAGNCCSDRHSGAAEGRTRNPAT